MVVAECDNITDGKDIASMTRRPVPLANLGSCCLGVKAITQVQSRHLHRVFRAVRHHGSALEMEGARGDGSWICV